MPPRSEAAHEPVPVTVLGGYLGAGKTTVLNRLLAGDHGRQLAVLVNDFGSVTIDADLITAHDGDTISLENGCVCCSIADALGDALDRALAFDPLPDHIVIEASGVADPAKVANYGRGWPGCSLDAVVVMADADTVRSQARDRFVGELVLRQLRAADVVVAAKVDLVDARSRAEVTTWLAEAAGGTAPVVTAVDGVVDHGLLLDPWPLHSTAGAGSEPEAPTAEDRFHSRVVALDRPVDRDELERALSGWPPELVRVKGIVSFGPGDRWVVQRVGRRWSLEPTGRTGQDRLLMISVDAGLDLEALGATLVPT